jgi:hypothetical protein
MPSIERVVRTASCRCDGGVGGGGGGGGVEIVFWSAAKGGESVDT